MPVLTTVTDSMAFQDNSSVLSLPALKHVGFGVTGDPGYLSVIGNTDLTNLSLPSLEEVGAYFQIYGNGKLKSLDFSGLEGIGESLDSIGDFSTPSMLELDSVRGGFNIQSSNSSINCTVFASENALGEFGVPYTCEIISASASSTTIPPSSTSTSPPASTSSASPIKHSSSTLSTGAKVGIGIAIPLVSIFALSFLFLARKGGFLRQKTVPDDSHPDLPELPRGEHHESTELSATTSPIEVVATT